jgi:cytochrome c-type biogenesis protein
MELLTNFLENSTMPWFTALVLGLMTAISPCPLAMNITAVGFISRDIEIETGYSSMDCYIHLAGQ